jgi:hypothetical protein
VISDAHKVIFVHQRKAGGTSLKALFEDGSEELNDGILDRRWCEDSRVDRYFKFTIIRNPWDRFMSAYFYIGALRRRSIDDVIRNMPNRDWTRDIRSGSLHSRVAYGGSHAVTCFYRAKRLLKGTNTWSESKKFHQHNFMHVACPQLETIRDSNGRIVVDAVYFLEDMQSALEDIKRRTGISTDLYRVKNAGTSPHDYRDLLSPAAQSRLYDIFYRDIDFFGYRFSDGPGVPPSPPMLRNSHFE